MRKGYSRDYREGALRYLETHKYKETADVFGITDRTLTNWFNLRDAGDVCPQREDTRKSKKLDHEKIRDYIKAHRDAYLYEVAAIFECGASSVWWICRKFGLVRKKKP